MGKETIKGMRSWVVCHDFASLYPTTIREFNLSADSFKGMLVPGQNYTIFNGKKLQLDPDDIITKTGAVFKNEMGVVNQVIGDVYADRKKYKKKMMATNLEIDALSHELEALEREVGDL
jgi:DNA polymerase elongation subunit (family B)